MVNPDPVNKLPMSLILTKGDICGATPPSLSCSANCKDPLLIKTIQSKSLFVIKCFYYLYFKTIQDN